MKRFFTVGLPVLLALLSGVGPATTRQELTPPEAEIRGTRRAAMLANRGIAPLPVLPPPDSREQIALGKRLFFDPLLSGSNRLSCASCHQQERGFADARRLSLGDDGKTVGRNTPSLINAVYSPFLFWDGRVGSLEAQALLPVENPAEMNQPVEPLLAELKTAGYENAFTRAFPGETITRQTVARALAAYERALTLTDTRLDRWLRGDKTAMSYEALRGLLVFTSEKAQCVSCHAGPNLTRARANDSSSFVRLGVAPVAGDPRDGGRATVPGERPTMEKLFARTGAFRIPSLRGVAQTAPYMHNGSLPTLRAVIDFYDRGGDEGLLSPLGLTEDEKRYLLIFLNEGLSAERTSQSPPHNP